jgi:hypothetical protein
LNCYLQSDYLGEFEDAEFHFDRHNTTQADGGAADPYTSDKIQDNLMARNIDAMGDLEELCVSDLDRSRDLRSNIAHLKELQLSIELCGSARGGVRQVAQTDSVHTPQVLPLYLFSHFCGAQEVVFAFLHSACQRESIFFVGVTISCAFVTVAFVAFGR